MGNPMAFSEKEMEYIHGLRRVPRLTLEEEVALLTRFLKGGDEEAKIRFVEASLIPTMEKRLSESTE